LAKGRLDRRLANSNVAQPTVSADAERVG
jgi:hypothetical protein